MNLKEYSRMYEAEEIHWWYAGLHQLVLDCLRREASADSRQLSVFDAGCGTGRLCQLMAAAGNSVSGCDVSEEALRFCRCRGLKNISYADLNSIELEAERYDAITAIDVLYHVRIENDVEVLKRLRKGLKPGGMLILNSVAYEFLRSTHDEAVQTRERYTRQELCRRLRSAGYVIEKASYRVTALFPFIAAYRLMSRLKKTGHGVSSDVALWRPLINALLLGYLELENAMLRAISLPFGSSIFVIGRKPARGCLPSEDFPK